MSLFRDKKRNQSGMAFQGILQDQHFLPCLGMERSLHLGQRLPGTSVDKSGKGGLSSARDMMCLCCSGVQESGRSDQSQGLRLVITSLGNSNEIDIRKNK